MTRVFELKSEQLLPRRLPGLFPFFAEARSLENPCVGEWTRSPAAVRPVIALRSS